MDPIYRADNPEQEQRFLAYIRGMEELIGASRGHQAVTATLEKLSVKEMQALREYAVKAPGPNLLRLIDTVIAIRWGDFDA
jgi:hypothetical protein